MSGRFETFDPASTEAILADIGTERERQDAKHGPIQAIPDGTGGKFFREQANSSRAITDRRAEKGTVTWADVLREEFYEAMAESDPALLREELIQTAAVCVKWVEHIDRRERVNA